MLPQPAMGKVGSTVWPEEENHWLVGWAKDLISNSEKRQFEGFLSSGFQIADTKCREFGLDMANEAIAPMRVEFRSSRGPFHFKIANRQVARIGLSALRQESHRGYIAKLAPQREFYTFEFATRGKSLCKSRGVEVPVDSSRFAALSSPDEETEWDDNGTLYEGVSLNVDKCLLASKFQALTGVKMPSDLCFSPKTNVESGAGHEIKKIVLSALDTLGVPDSIYASNSVGAQFEELIAVMMLNGFEHSQSALLSQQAKSANQKSVSRVCEYIEAHYQHAIKLETLAEVSGTSVRSLQRSFQQHLGLSPLQFLKKIRLQNARNRLLHMGDACNVSQIAYLAGFRHLGNFTADYRKMFGERPSETVKRLRVSR